MKKTILSVFLVYTFLCSLLSICCFAEEEEKATIRVGYYDLEEFLIGASPELPKSGFAYDLLCEIATVNGWKYELVYGNFSDLLEDLYAGKIDLLPCVVFSEERAERLLYSEKSISEERYFISVLTEKAKLLSHVNAQILDGAKISTVKDAYQNRILESWAAENKISFELVCSDSFTGSWEALDRGEADFVLNIDNSAPSSGYTTLFEIGASYSHFAAAPGREAVIQGIDSAIRTIQQINPFVISHLQEKYLSSALSSYQLSVEEESWVAEHPVIRVAGLKDDMPYSYYDESGNVTGVFPEMFSMLLSSLSVASKTEWTLFDSIEQMTTALKSGEADLICPYYHNHYLAQTNGLINSEYITNVPMGILSKENSTAFTNGRVAVPVTRLGIYYLREFFPDTQILPCDSVTKCIKAVHSGAATAAVAHYSALQEHAKQFTDNFSIQVLKSSCPVCFTALPENNELIMLINRGLHLIPDTEIESLEMIYTPVDSAFTFRELLREHLAEIAAIIAFLVLLVAFLVERIMASRKLRKNVMEISRQKELIEQKEAELIEARDMANEANNAKTVFLFNMSHDIRTPMNAIIGYTGMAKKKCKNQPQIAEYLEKIDIAGNNLLSIVNQVLEMSRIEAGKVELAQEPINLIDNYNIQKTIVESNAAVHGITLNSEIGTIQDCHVITDAGRLNQVITNILGNAIKYTREGGSVTYSLRQLGKDEQQRGIYEFNVTDTGIGMSQEFQEHIFDQFSRERTSTVSGIQGTGLGMSIVKKIVTLMDGEIRVDSELGKGTSVTVKLPLLIDCSSPETAGEEAFCAPKFEGRHVLLVEDNEMNREIASEILADCGIIVDEAENGAVAVQKVSEVSPGTYDFILMDVQMPVMDGYEATAAIRKLKDTALANIPIIALSANAFEEDRNKSLAAGMNDHIAKPIDINVLFQTIGKYLS